MDFSTVILCPRFEGGRQKTFYSLFLKGTDVNVEYDTILRAKYVTFSKVLLQSIRL